MLNHHDRELNVVFDSAQGGVTYSAQFPFARAHAGELVDEAPIQVAVGMLAHVTQRLDGTKPDQLPCSGPECAHFPTSDIAEIELHTGEDDPVVVTMAEIADYIRQGHRAMGDGTRALTEKGVKRFSTLFPQLGL